LRRGGSTTGTARAVAPAESPVRPAAPAAPATSPLTSPPGRAIAREAVESRPAARSAPEMEIPDYGREIELPDEIPPPAPREAVTMAAAPSSVTQRTPVSEPVPSKSAGDAPRRTAAPQPSNLVESTLDQIERDSGEVGATQSIVVPVKIPANGATGELVIRIVFERQD
jgi:hypothetical protein